MTVTLGAPSPQVLRRRPRRDAVHPHVQAPAHAPAVRGAVPLSPVARVRPARTAAPSWCRWCDVAQPGGASATNDIEFGWYSRVLARVLADVDPRLVHGVEDASAEQLRWAATCRGTGDRPVLELLARAIAQGAPSGSIVDVGAGTGGPSAYLSVRTGLPVLAVEPSTSSLRTARHLFGDVDRVQFVQGTSESLPAPDGSAAAVTMLGLLSLLEDVTPTLREARRVAAPGAVLALTDYTAPDADARDSVDLPDGTSPDVSGELLAALAATGWDVEHVVDGAMLPDRAWLACRDAVDAAIARHVALTPHGMGDSCPAAHEAETEARTQFSRAIQSGRVRRLTVVARAH